MYEFLLKITITLLHGCGDVFVKTILVKTRDFLETCI